MGALRWVRVGLILMSEPWRSGQLRNGGPSTGPGGPQRGEADRLVPRQFLRVHTPQTSPACFPNAYGTPSRPPAGRPQPYADKQRRTKEMINPV